MAIRNLQTGKGANNMKKARTIYDIQRANKAIGHFFFSKGAMEFFNSKIYPEVYGGRYFITSERYSEKDDEKFTIREASERGEVETVGEFMAYRTQEAAIDAINVLISEKLQERE